MKHFLPLAILLTFSPMCALAEVKVVVSIKPIHSLVSSIMDGAGTPALLLDGSASPHDYVLKPSDAQILQDADLVISMGPALEGFLTKPLNSLAAGKSLPLLDTLGLAIIPIREDSDEHESHPEGENHHGEGTADPHIWLNPSEATKIASAITSALVKRDPTNASIYQNNFNTLSQELTVLNQELTTALRPLPKAPVVVFHDAYQYFEKAFDLAPSKPISLNPEASPGAKRIKALRRELKANKIACVFAEPQFDDRLVKTIVEGTRIKTDVLDPLGSRIPSGKDHYKKTLEALSKTWGACLK